MIQAFTEMAEDLGFVAVGFSRPGPPLHMDFYLRWVNAGKQGDMSWMARNLDIRREPTKLLPSCRTVVSLAWPYPKEKPATPEGLTVSRYARPDALDYHVEIKEKCRSLAEWLCRQFPGERTRICVDSAPILERSFAQESGIGCIGKNTMLIVPGYGSYIYLAEILTTAELSAPEALSPKDPCGDCTRCLDACPTGALEAPYSLNASRCLSYLTIEWSGDVDEETGKRMGDCFLGCDRCQEACPHNNGGVSSRRIVLPPARDFLGMDADTFESRFGRTALARPGLAKIQSNLKAIWRKNRRRKNQGTWLSL
ncbi:MAG: tRNA epoxyqueuosine(34) reductase QueG [Desulfobacteraceae bacterium]|jgi:epoxyqueuosine reductase